MNIIFKVFCGVCFLVKFYFSKILNPGCGGKLHLLKLEEDIGWPALSLSILFL